MKRKITIRMSSLLIAVLLICTVVPVSISAKSESKHDYSGLISRMDKFLNYCSEENQAELFYYRFKCGPKRFFGIDYNFFKYCDLISFDTDEKSERLFKEVEVTGLPEIYYVVKWSELSKNEVEAAVKKYCDESSIDYVDWMVDALWSDDPLVVIETLMYPDYVIDMDKYNSDEPKIWKSEEYGSFYYTYFATDSYNLLRTSVEVLEGWGYSDAYWLDYYSFIQYLTTDEIKNDPIYGRDANSMTKGNAIDDEVLLAELDRRVELYANRVANAETGDESAVRVVFLATAAVVCAVIPATVAVTIKRRRRED